jgi:hypothetical protein
LRASLTVPAVWSIEPGEPTPMPINDAVSTFAALAASRTVSAIASATAAGPPLVGVGVRALPST